MDGTAPPLRQRARPVHLFAMAFIWASSRPHVAASLTFQLAAGRRQLTVPLSRLDLSRVPPRPGPSRVLGKRELRVNKYPQGLKARINSMQLAQGQRAC